MKYKMRLNVQEFEALQLEQRLGESETARRIGVRPEQLWKIKKGVSGVGQDFIAGCMVVFPNANIRNLFFVDKLACVQAGGELKNAM